MNMENKKEILVLSELEHILHRPNIFIGSTKPTEEKVFIIKGNKLISETKSLSVGLYKILNEAIDRKSVV